MVLRDLGPVFLLQGEQPEMQAAQQVGREHQGRLPGNRSQKLGVMGGV